MVRQGRHRTPLQGGAHEFCTGKHEKVRCKQARCTDFEGGAAMGYGSLPRGKISKIKANCKHFRAFGAISVQEF